MDLLVRRSRRFRRLRSSAAIGCAAALMGLFGCSSDEARQSEGQRPDPAESASVTAETQAPSASAEATAANAGADLPASADTGIRTGPPVALFVGTSLTAGLGLSPEDAYPAVLQRMADSADLSVRVVNAGESGETSANLICRLPWVLQRHADVVVIETGANDGLRGLNVDSTTENLRRVVSAVRAELPEAEILLVQMEAPPNLGAAYTSRFRGMYGEVAEEMGIVLVPFLLDGVAGERALNQADGIHPNEEGARLAAANVWPAFSRALARAGTVAQPR